MSIAQMGGDDDRFHSGYQASQAERLDLDDGDDSLPWLEGDEDYYQDPRSRAPYVLLGVAAVLVVLAGLLAFWWISRDGGGSGLVADGSTIEAPEGPYKEKPEDPGGKRFAGTGDASYRVAEGEEAEGRLAADAIRPSIDVEQSGEDEGPSIETEQSPAASGVAVQVGAYSNRSGAQAGWVELNRRYPALAGVDYRIVEGQADIGTVFRLQAMAGDRAAANALCNELKSQGGACQVK